MNAYSIKNIAQNPQLLNRAVDWFHAKWSIPKEAYEESMRESLEGRAGTAPVQELRMGLGTDPDAPGERS